MSDKLISLEGKPQLDGELLKGCIHCGLCLPACPTYLATGREVESPRGRIHLLSKLQSGEAALTDRLSQHIESCLGCLGCQTACPSGVQYETILNQARPYLAARRDSRTRAIMRLAFQQILPRYTLLRLMGTLLRVWQMLLGRDLMKRIGQGVTTKDARTPFAKLMARLAEWEEFLPQVPSHIGLPQRVSPREPKQSGVHANLFYGCVMDVFYNHVNHASIRLMVKQGHSVDIPKQTCCGALAYHAGEADIATSLAKKNIDLFGYSSSPIVVTSAGCGAMLKHYGELLHDDRDYGGRAKEFSKRVLDLSEFLDAHEFQSPAKPLAETITYHAACHLAHAQNVRKPPEALLERLAIGEEPHVVPLVEAEHCCGSAGIYNLFNTALSLKVLARKMDYIESTGAKTVVTCNPGCMLQLEAGVKERNLDVQVKHLAEVLDEHF